MIDRAYASSNFPLLDKEINNTLDDVIKWNFPDLIIKNEKIDKILWIIEKDKKRIVVLSYKSKRMIQITPFENERFDVESGWIAHIVANELAKRWRGRRSFSREPKLTWCPHSFSISNFDEWKKIWKQINF